MSAHKNKHELEGTIGRVEHKTTKNGKAVLVIRLATDEGHRGHKVTYWHRLVMWDKLAEKYSSLAPGDSIYIEGPNRTRGYMVGTEKRWITETVVRKVHNVDFLTRRTHGYNRGINDEEPPTFDEVAEDTFRGDELAPDWE